MTLFPEMTLFRRLALVLSLLPVVLQGAVRQGATTGVSVEAEFLLPTAGQSVNAQGTIGNFGAFHWVGRRSASAGGDVELSSEVTAVLFSGDPPSVELSNQSVMENQSLGSLVGAFSSEGLMNPSYTLVSDGGGRFLIDGNSLVTALILDYEQNATRHITVRATGTNGGSVEKDFAIQILDDAQEDEDGDGLTQAEETAMGTSDLNADSDNDGFSDGDEVSAGSDPLDGNSRPSWMPQNVVLTPAEVKAGLEAGALVGQLTFTDPNPSNAYLFSLAADSNGSTLDNEDFAIDTLGQLTTSKVLSREDGDTRMVRIRIIKDIGQSFEKTFTVSILAGDAITEEPEPVAGELVLSNTSVEENLGAGTEVGELSIAGSSDFYQYRLEGAGYEHFEIDGPWVILRQSLDFEIQSEHQLEVSAWESGQKITSKVFKISVIDAFRPIVWTNNYKYVSESRLELSGNLLDAGSVNGVTERGILISNQPDVQINSPGTTQILAGGKDTGEFTVQSGNVPGKRKLYFRAYASHREGISYGASMEIGKAGTSPELFSEWSGASLLIEEDAWWNSPWFGTFYASEKNGWIMHEDLGWVYTFPSSSGGFWLWMENLNWMWSRRDLYPFLYSNQKASWIFFYGKVEDELLFYDYRENLWLRPRRPKEL